MKNKILSFALPLLLLAATPAVADDARLLWVSVDGAATVEDGDTNPPVAQYQSANTGHSINAFRVSVPDASASGGTNHLAFAYEEDGSMVVGGTEPVVRSLDVENGGAVWAPLDLAAYDDRDLVVTMELGYVDPANASSFEKLAFATEHLGSLLDAPHVSIQSDLNPPALTPWAPETFTVTVPWAIAYDLAGGTNNAANPEFYTEGQLPIALLPAGREGYMFAGWTNELGAVVEEIAAGSTGDRSFGATWLENVEPPAPEPKVYTGAPQTADVPSNAGYTVVSNVGGTDVGEYAVTLSLAAGYAWSDGTIADKTVTWSITPATMTVLSEDWTGAYDAEGHSPSATASVVEGTTFEYSLDGAVWSATAPAFTNVVATNVHIRAINPNYTTASTNVALTVTNRIVTLTGASGSETYTGSAQTLDTFETDGLVQDHVLSGVTYAATGTDVADSPYAGAFSGTPVVTAPGDVDVTANYAFAYVPGALTITPGTMTISVEGCDTVYDGASHAASATTDPAGATVTWSTDNGATWSSSVPSITDVGTVTAIAKASKANYADATSEPVTLQVTQKAVTVTADNKGKTYGEADPELTATVAGLVGEDTVSYTVSRAAGEEVGTYAITPAGDASQGNYAVSYAAGTFTISAAAINLEAAGYSGTYDGSAHAAAVASVDPADATIEWSTDNGTTWSSSAPSITDVGTVTAIAKASKANYADATSEPVTLQVTQKAVTVTADNKGKTYGEADPELTATVAGLVGEDTVSYTVSRAAGEEVGTYAITPAGDASQGNYAVSYAAGTFTISAAAINLEAAGYSGTYDGSAHAAAVASVDPADATIEWSTDNGTTWSSSAPSITDVGTVTAIAKASKANYADATSEPVTLQVTQKAVTVTADDKGKTYGDADPELTATATGLLGADTVSYTVSRAPGESVGTYAITPAGDASQGNYAVSYEPGTLTVGAKAVTVTANDITIDHGAAAPAYTYTVTGLVGGESLATEPALSCDYAQGDGIGTYAISVTNAAASANYAISYTPGTLTVQSKKYTVTFQNEDGTPLQSSEVEWGETPAYTGETPTKADTERYTYTFAGWSPEVAEVTADAVYTATYTWEVREYLISWYNDGEFEFSESYSHGATPWYPRGNGTPTKDDDAEYIYTFDRWSPPIVPVTNDASYNATYTREKRSYWITWLNDDGSLIDETIVEYGDLPTHEDASKAPTAQYTYTFAGWTPAVSNVTGEATYTAQFDETVNEYTVSFVDWDGTPIVAEDYPYGTAVADIVLPADPVREATAEYAYTFAGWEPALAEVLEDATYTATYTSTSLANAIWIGGFLGDWDTAANWDIGYLPTPATVVTFTNNAEVGINQALCKEIVLADNAYVAITPASGVSEPLLHFSGNGDRTGAVSGSGTLAVNYIGLFNDNYSGELEIGTAFEILNDITFRGNASGNPAASFAITNKTTISADAWVKSIDKASTLFAEGIDVAKGVTAYMKTLNQGHTRIGYENVTLVANDGEGNPTAIWLMQGGASLNYGAKVVVDADHAADYYVNTREDSLEGGTYTVYEALPKPTVVSVSATGATVTGVTSGQRVVPGENLTIGAAGLAEGYEAVLVITMHSDGSELVNTKELPCVYSMPDYDVDVTVTAVLKTFTVTWLDEDGTTQLDATNGVPWGTAYASLSAPNPTKEATAACTYTFADWVPQPEETVTSNATYTASFTETTNKYTVAFAWHGGSSEADYDYGTRAADVAVPRDPPSYVENDTIYTFTNWNPAVVADVTGAATYTAQYADAAAVATVITVADATTGATTTNYYATLAEAIGAAPTNSTVRLLADVEEPAVALDTPITLDLNGKTWTVAGTGEPPVTNAVAVSAAVAVVDNSENGGGAIDSAAHPVVTVAQGGALTVGEKARITEPTGFPGTTVEVAAGGALVVDGAVDGDVEAGAGGAVSIAGAVWGDVSAAGEGATVAVNGGTVGGDVTVAGGADVSVTGEYANVVGGIAATGAGSEIAVSGGATVTEDVVANGGASATVDGGTVIGALAAQNGGSVEVASGSVSGGVSATGAGSTAEVSGGEVSSALGAGVTVAAGATGTVSGDASVSGGVLATGAGSSVEVEGGTVLGGVVAADSAEAEVSGGTVGSVLADGGRVVVSGGSVSGDASAANGGALEIGDGSVAQTVQVDAASTAEITGGAVGDGIVAFGADSVRVEGGTVAGTIVAPTDAVVVTGGTFTEDPSQYVAQGYYAARVGEVFEVRPQKSILETTIVIADAGAYDGTGKEPTVTVTTNGVEIAATDGYTLSWTNNTNAGVNTASVKVSGTGAWMGETNLTFTIAKKPLGLVWSGTNLVYTGAAQKPMAAVTGVVAGDDVSVVVSDSDAQSEPGTYTATASLSGAQAGNYALPDPATTEFTITAVYVAQVGTEKFFAIADAITAAGGLVAEPEVITLLDDADASVTLTAPSQRLRVALDGHELTVLSGDPIRYEVATNVEDSVTVYALEQLKADGLMIVRFDYAARNLAYDMGTAENMLNMYPTNEPIYCTVVSATDLRATNWTAVEDSRRWKENLVPLESATDGDLEWLENLDTTSSLVRFWRIAVTPFDLKKDETVEFRAAAPADPDGD